MKDSRDSLTSTPGVSAFLAGYTNKTLLALQKGGHRELLAPYWSLQAGVGILAHIRKKYPLGIWKIMDCLYPYR